MDIKPKIEVAAILATRCRTCGGPTELEGLSLLDHSVFIARWLPKALRLEVNSSNEFPTSICQGCLEKVERWISFNERIFHHHLPDKPAPESTELAKEAEIDEAAIKARFPQLRDLSVVLLRFDPAKIARGNERKIKSEARQGKTPVTSDKKAKLHIFACHICRKKSSSPNTFVRHLREEHGLSKNKADKHVPLVFSCNVCPDKTFAKYFNYRTHMMQIHLNPGRFTCDGCGKKFNRFEHFKRHLGTHKCVDIKYDEYKNQSGVRGRKKDELIGNKRFKCKKCDQRFFCKYDRRVHVERYHSGLARPYECQRCGADFKTRHDVAAHVSAAHRDHRFACNQCSKTFATFYVRRKHEREVHVTGQPHRCETCSKTYKARRNLLKHVKSAHNPQGLKFICHFCGKDCKSRYSIYYHIAGKHKRQISS